MSPSSNQRLLFIAILPPQAIQDEANHIKQEFADRYDSRAAQKSPPHITLQPPFEWPMDSVTALQACLQRFSATQPPIPLILKGFKAFPPRVIYIDVLGTQALFECQRSLSETLKTELNLTIKENHHPFVPHMTVAFRDLTPQNFKAAWPTFQERSFDAEFLADALTLLLHDGQQWLVWKNFSLLLK